jgi:4-amino-4-deoxy-L-arabinose transferase-like glycosyltransferase
MSSLFTQHHQTDAGPRGFEALYANPLPWLIALAAAHIAIRVAISPALKWDEAQQILWTQHLQWGYGAQPPLYTWLQWGVVQLLGPCVLALSLLKHTLLALTCVFMWLAGRELLGPRATWWTAASLFLLPPFGWYAIRDLTHTVLVTTMTCGTWWLLLRIVRREGIGCQREFAALGLMCGFGMLSKYSFALMAAAFIAALLSVREPRRALFGRGWWWALPICLVVVAPHGWWLLSHWHAATGNTIQEMSIMPHHGWGRGLGNLFVSVLGTLGLWAIFALAAFRSDWWRRPQPAPENIGRSAAWLWLVLWRYLALIAIALLVMVFAADVTVFKSRWVLPLLAPVPLMAFALRPELESNPRGKWFTGLTLALILVILVAAGARPWFAYIDGGTDELNHPAVQLAQALHDAGYNGHGRIIAADHMLAGMLRTRFPAAPADVCYRDAGSVADCVAGNVQQAERVGQGWLIISRADRIEPDWWNSALSRIPEGDNLPRSNLRIPFRMVRRDHALASYDFVWHPAYPQ